MSTYWNSLHCKFNICVGSLISSDRKSGNSMASIKHTSWLEEGIGNGKPDKLTVTPNLFYMLREKYILEEVQSQTR